jgi:Glutamine synthetase, catalytic domain
MTRTALVLQHQRNAPPALLSDWARQRGVELTVRRADRAPTLPEPDAFAFAITLGSDHMYGTGEPLPSNLADGIAAARADAVITEILGEDAVHDYTKLAEYEWETFLSAVTDWDRDRYLTSI